MATQRPVHIDATSGNVRELVAGDKLGGITNGTATGEALTFDAIGVSVQAYDADIAAIAALTSAADKGVMFVGANTAATFDLTAAARTVLDDATVAAMVDTLGGAASTGTGGLARATSPTFVTPILGAASATSLACPTLTSASGAINVNPANDLLCVNGAAGVALQVASTGTYSFMQLTNSGGSTKSGAWVQNANGEMTFASEVTIFANSSGGTERLRYNSAELFLADGYNIRTRPTTGSILATSATAEKLSVFNATPIVQPTAAGQAALAAQGQQTLTDSTAGTAGTTLAAVTGAVYATDVATIRDWIASLAAQLALVKTDVANLRTLVDAQRSAMVNFGSMKGS
jgi:hypothetical protein